MSLFLKSSLALNSRRSYFIFTRYRNNNYQRKTFNYNQRRTFILGRIISGVLRLRYLALASTVSGGYYINKKYEEIKQAFPDLGQFKMYLPEPQRIDNLVYTMRSKIHDFSDLNKNLMSEFYIGAEERYKDFEQWIIEKSAEVGSTWEKPAVEDKRETEKIAILEEQIINLENTFSKKAESVQKSHPEIDNLQKEHEKEKVKLEEEIKELRRQLLINKKRRTGRQPQIKKSLIEMYSEVLDELSEYDTNYNVQDHLPRVVVVGEQSAGKTSVLEMVAQSRLFPRGAGSIMTKAPVKVTLAEGPFPVARFDAEDGPEFDLSTDQGQAALRSEIEIRMNQMSGSETTTKQTISLSVKGPNLNRLVLVDLPGIINTTTSDMKSDTKDAILALAKQYMNNPNSIILCIQDASRDAESSSIIDLVSSLDPMGKRTIFVLTKVDQAESQLSDPNRIKDILSGKVYKMKALGYFAVVTGKGNNNDESISTIKDYEEDFFKSSKLFRDGVMKSNQMTTRNLSKAVSDRFWKMIQESVEHEADTIKARRFNMENEWRHKYSGLRELDRVELFERAKGEILDNLIKLSTISPTKWEDNIIFSLWNKIKDDVFEGIYIPAHESSSSIGHYKMTIENKLKPWAEKRLTTDTVEVGWEVMKNTLVQISNMKSNKASAESELFKEVQSEVQKRSFALHKWDKKADSSLRIIQSEALNDIPIKSKTEWDDAVKFLSLTLDDHIASIKKSKSDLKGPGFVESWAKWSTRNPLQWKRCAVFDELKNILENEPNHTMTLTPDELTTIKRNLKMKKIDADTAFIKDIWLISYKEALFEKAKSRADDCRKGFYHYHYGFADKADFDCRDVVFFRRLLRMLETSAGALRNQIMNNEIRRMETIVKEVLDDIGADSGQLQKLLVGDRVQLAENLKRVRHIQEKLDEFITALNKDK